MKRFAQLTLLLTLSPAFALAEQKRELGSHEHGAGTLNIAIEDGTIAMEFEAPGADIAGFEHAAATDEDRATIAAAISDLARPLELFVLPAAAGCTVTAASVEVLGDDAHDDGGHDGHDGEHAHEEEHGHGEEHAHEEEHGHDEEHAHEEEQGHDEEHAHDGHDDHETHDSHEEAGAEHSEFHAEYMIECSDPAQIGQIDFAYFSRFPNAVEMDVQIISASGAQSFEVGRDAPVLDIRGLF